MKKDYKETLPKATLEKSATQREEILAKLGFEPVSLWWLQTQHKTTFDVLAEDTLAKGSYEKCNFSIRDGALSQFSPIVAERLVKFFTEKNDLIFTPFTGRAAHLLIANYFGRNCYGQDISKVFYEHDVEKVKRRIQQQGTLDSDNNKILSETPTEFMTILGGLNFGLRLQDSRKILLNDNSVDFCLSSPPYFCLETYGNEPEQLGKADSYEDFLKELQIVHRECYRTLKPGKFIAVIVNDFRYKNRFYTYHADCLRDCESLGFIPWDIIIYNLSVHPLQSIFVTQLVRDKHQAKMHEYILIFKKPGA